MDFTKTKLLSAMKMKLSYLGQRQSVLSANLANANTPGYQAKDIKPVNFNEMVKNTRSQVGLKTTSAKHINTNLSGTSYKIQKDKNVFEVKPDGNTVTLEDQMMKISNTGMQYQETIMLLSKMSEMLKIAMGRGR